MPNPAGMLAFDWDAPVSGEERDRIFNAIVNGVRRWRLEVPAILFLETGAPLSPLAGQGMIVGSPFLAALLPGGVSDVQKLSKILERPDNVRELVDRIEESRANAARG